MQVETGLGEAESRTPAVSLKDTRWQNNTLEPTQPTWQCHFPRTKFGKPHAGWAHTSSWCSAAAVLGSQAQHILLLQSKSRDGPRCEPSPRSPTGRPQESSKKMLMGRREQMIQKHRWNLTLTFPGPSSGTPGCT